MRNGGQMDVAYGSGGLGWSEVEPAADFVQGADSAETNDYVQ